VRPCPLCNTLLSDDLAPCPTCGGRPSTSQTAKDWPSYHRRLYLRAEPASFLIGAILLVPGALLAGNPNVLRFLPTISDSIVLDSLVVATLARIVGCVLIGVGYRFVRTAKRVAAVSADERLRLDPRPRILYIRAFADDAHLIGKADPGEKFVDPTAWAKELRFEEVLAAALAPVGAMYAIGRPGEELPPLGAVRRYPKGAWEDAFRQMHAECALVAVQAGRGNGLTYELIEAFKPKSFKPIVVCFPPDTPGGPPPEKRYAEFRALLEQQKIAAVLAPHLGRGYFVWFSTPLEGVVLTAKEVSFEARQANSVFPGYTAVRQKFDEIIPGMTWHAVHKSEHGLVVLHSIVASIAIALSILTTYVLYL
jgi:hypothetical protein